jgi:hypothetical protein
MHTNTRQEHEMQRRWSAWAAVLLVAALSTGCAQSGGVASPTTRSPAGTPDAPSTTASQTTSGTPAANPGTTQTGAVATATDGDNGRELTLRPGQQLKVVLASTYWTIVGSSNTAVLRTDGQPHTNPQPSGCVPGGGCGTVTQVFVAVAAGQAMVTATRTSCGEAMGCVGSSGQYSLRVIVH